MLLGTDIQSKLSEFIKPPTAVPNATSVFPVNTAYH